MDLTTIQTQVGGESYPLDKIAETLGLTYLKNTGSGHVLEDSEGNEYYATAESLVFRKHRGDSYDPVRTVTSLEPASSRSLRRKSAPSQEPQSPVEQAQEMKGYSGMNINIDGHVFKMGDKPISRLPESMRDRETITAEEIEVLINDSATPAANQKAFTLMLKQYRSKISESNQSQETQPESSAEPLNQPQESQVDSDNGSVDSTDAALPPSLQFNEIGDSNQELPPSKLFNQDDISTKGQGKGLGKGRKRGPKTPEEKAADKRNRELKADERNAKARAIEGQLQTSNELLKNHSDFVETVAVLRDILAVYNGAIGIDAPVTTMNTRLRARVTNTVKPDERKWHPNVSNPDTSKSGKAIEAKYALGAYDVDLVESNPGAVMGFLMRVPPGLTADHLSSLTSVLTAQEIRKLASAKDSGGKGYVTIPVDKIPFTQLLAILAVPAYFVTPKGERDLTKDFFFAEPRMKDDIYWYALRACNREGNITKLACAGYIPLATYNLTNYAQCDQRALTQLLFGRSLTVASSFTNATKFTQLTQQAAAKFNDDVDNLLFNGFRESQSVPGYLSTKKNVVSTTLKLPATKWSEPTADKGASPQFVKSRYNESGYQAIFSTRVAPFKELLGSFRRVSQSSKQSDAVRKLGTIDAILRAAQGSVIRTSSKITN